MNKAFGWILHLGWAAVLVSLVALPAHAQLMIGHMGHGGDCSIKTGAFPVSFSAYEKPKGALPPTHAYCDHVPEVGEHILTVDLQGTKSREIPIGVRLVSATEGQGDGGNTIMSMPAKLYPSGSITFAVNLKELGQYNLLLETEKADKMSTAVTIPIHVGDGGGHGGHSGIGMIEIALLLGAGGGIAAFFWLRRKPSKTVEEPQQ
ncbi:MAG: hypothetical protein ACE1Y1_07460 [Nitrosomonadaceae bacterium]